LSTKRSNKLETKYESNLVLTVKDVVDGAGEGLDHQQQADQADREDK
jgi:hypothetical protein